MAEVDGLHARPGDIDRAKSYDIVVLADMTRPGDCDLRISTEVRCYAAAGYRTAVGHLQSRRSRRAIAPEVRRCVGAGEAEVVDPAWTVETGLLVIHSPQFLSLLQPHLRRLTARRTVAVVNQLTPFDVEAKDQALVNLFGPVSWFATNEWARDLLDRRAGSIGVEEATWDAIAIPSPRRSDRRGKPMVLGWIANASPDVAPAPATALPAQGDLPCAVLVLGSAGDDPLSQGTSPPGFVFEHGSTSIDRYLDKIDVLAFFPPTAVPELPDALIAAAMARGKPVILPPRLTPHYGSGPIYCEAERLSHELRSIADDPERLPGLGDAARRAVETRFSAVNHRKTVDRLIAPDGIRPADMTVRTMGPASRSSCNAIFIPANGVGLGNVARSLAIARRMGDAVEPIFVTVGSGAEAVESFGFTAECVAPAAATLSDQRVWDEWFAIELEQLIDAYHARLVVFDGSNPRPGLVAAVAPRGDCRFAWIRQGMIGSARMPYLENANYFDLIVEPDDLASDRDRGPTVARRSEVSVVDPIVLLDESELLAREEAARALGLDHRRPAVLIQLGAGANWDVPSIIDKVMSDLEGLPDYQVAILEWSIGSGDLSLWPRARTIRGFPVSRYLKAFDFCVAAAGYNTFHELISYGVPAIFVPNPNPATDDQTGRAVFAEESGAALHLDSGRFHELAQMLQVLQSAQARNHLSENCRRLRRANGAAQAARALRRLIDHDGPDDAG